MPFVVNLLIAGILYWVTGDPASFWCWMIGYFIWLLIIKPITHYHDDF